MKKILTLLALLCLSSQLFSQNKATIEKARNMVKQMVAKENIIGLAISVSVDDQLVWSEGFGYRDLNKENPIVPGKTHFRIASLSKPITATILGRLWEDKIVEVDQSLYKYVPSFPRKKYDFTLRHLATHRSGIRHYKRFEKENRKPLSIEEGLGKFKKSKLRFKPGTRYSYSSYAYNLLGVAMEKASKKTFPDLLAQYVTKPLGMNHTIGDQGNYEQLNTSGFFSSNGRGKTKKAKEVNMFMKMPSGGMLSTSEDLVRLGNAYIYGRILKKATQQEMLKNTPLPNGKKVGYGMGWGIGKDKKGRPFISHTGGNTGSVCRIVVYPEQKMTIVILSNTFGIDYLQFIRNLAKISNMILTDLER